MAATQLRMMLLKQVSYFNHRLDRAILFFTSPYAKANRYDAKKAVLIAEDRLE